MEIDQDEVEALANAITALPVPDKEPDNYPNSLALCVLDSIYSLGVNYRQVENLVGRYRSHREREGADACMDTPSDLVGVFDRVGGPANFAEYVGNRTLTFGPRRILKAESVELTARMLADSGIETTTQLRDLSGSKRLKDLERKWREVQDENTGTTWRYFLMLAGLDGVKADRMIHSFCKSVSGHTYSNEEATELVTAAARQLELSPTDVDYRIWTYERGK